MPPEKYHLTAQLKWIVLTGALLCSLSGYTEESINYYNQGVAFYEARQYKEAQQTLEKAVELSPDVSVYHHMLGKSYGRMAQQSNWIAAIFLARKTLREFQTAVELDGENSQALEDLIQYYLQAPAFLGGSNKKAEQIQEKLDLLDDPETTENSPPVVVTDAPKTNEDKEIH